MQKRASIFLFFVFILMTTNTYAWKLFGSETYKLTSADGCTVTTYERTYFLGIKISVEPVNVEYICDFE